MTLKITAMITTKNYKSVETTNNPHGVDARKLHGNEHVQVVHMHLKAGEYLKKHTTAVDVFFYVLEGEGIVEIPPPTEPPGAKPIRPPCAASSTPSQSPKI